MTYLLAHMGTVALPIKIGHPNRQQTIAYALGLVKIITNFGDG
jgi:hypothetical protein